MTQIQYRFIPQNEAFSRIETLFEQLTNKELNSPRLASAAYPKTDISETESSYIFEMAVPLLEKGEVEVEIEKGYLTIKGQKAQQKEDKKLIYSELKKSSFTRSFDLEALECAVDYSKIKAEHKNGVVTIVAPKKEQTKRQKLL